MSWLFSQVLVEEYLGDTSLDGEQSALLNGNPIQQAFCAPDKMTVFSRLSRFGMTYKPLTESHGEELCKLYREAFLVRTYQPQEKVQELTENAAECGEKWRASFTKYDLDSSSWKTHQCSLLGDLDEFLETWPQWGLMRDGECWEQTPLEPSTDGKEFGFWGTPTTSQDFKPVRKLAPSEANGKHGTILVGSIGKEHPHLIGRYLKPLVTEYLMGWPLGWTDLKPLEMDKSHFVQQQLGES
jgi:hypothetical protein